MEKNDAWERQWKNNESRRGLTHDVASDSVDAIEAVAHSVESARARHGQADDGGGLDEKCGVDESKGGGATGAVAYEGGVGSGATALSAMCEP